MPTIARAAELARQRVVERVYRQEWLAEFLEETGGIFRRVREAAVLAPQPRQEGHQYVIGVDWGKLVDHTVLSVVDATTRRQVFQDRFNKIDYAVQKGRLQALCERYRPAGVYAEQNSMGVPLVEDLQRLGLPVFPFVTTHASKLAVIDGLALAFERGDLKILNDPDLVNELLAYQADRLPSGGLRYAAPEGMHDDCVMGLALAYYGASQPTEWVF
jgi:Terminase RNaseH-like domain